MLAVSLEQQDDPRASELLCDLCKKAPMLVRSLVASKLTVKAVSDEKIRSLVFSVLDQSPPMLANTLLVSLMMLSRFSPALRDEVLQRIDGDWPVFGVELPPDMLSFSLFSFVTSTRPIPALPRAAAQTTSSAARGSDRDCSQPGPGRPAQSHDCGGAVATRRG